jgi:excisionase family DNA binding protein
MEPLQSVEEAARSLSLSAWTVRAYIRQGKIRPVRIGRRVLLEERELRRVIEQGRSQGAHPQEQRESTAKSRGRE